MKIITWKIRGLKKEIRNKKWDFNVSRETFMIRKNE